MTSDTQTHALQPGAPLRTPQPRPVSPLRGGISRKLASHVVTKSVQARNTRPLGVYHAAGWREDGRVKERLWLGVPIREPRLVKHLGLKRPR